MRQCHQVMGVVRGKAEAYYSVVIDRQGGASEKIKSFKYVSTEEYLGCHYSAKLACASTLLQRETNLNGGMLHLVQVPGSVMGWQRLYTVQASVCSMIHIINEVVWSQDQE